MPLIAKGKYFFGSTKVGEKGQIVIPKEARDIFEIKPGDSVLIMGDEEKGIAVVKATALKGFVLNALGHFQGLSDKEEKSNG